MAASRSYRHRVKVMESVPVQDQTTGDMVTYWQALALDSSVTLDSVPADVLTGPGRDFREAGAVQSDVVLRVSFRWFDGLLSTHMIEYLGLGYEIRSIEKDATGRLEYRVQCVGVGKVLDSVPVVISCAYPLDADAAEYTAAGVTPLLMNAAFDTGTFTVPGPSGVGAQHIAMPAGFLYQTSAVMDFSSGDKVVEFPITFPAAVNTGGTLIVYWLRGIIATRAFSVRARIDLQALSNGLFSIIIYGTGVTALTLTNQASVPSVIAFVLSGASNTFKVRFDDVEQVLDFNTFTGSSELLSFLDVIDAPINSAAGDAGKLISVGLRTNATDMTGTYVDGETDPCGNAL